MGNKDSGNIGVWTNEEMERFLNAVSDKPVVKYAFFLLYWTGIRLGELLALNIADIDFEKKTLSVTKSLNRIDGKDVISLPKTKSSIRTIYLPQFVMDEMKDYCGMLYGRGAKDRLFVVTKSHLEKEIKRGAENPFFLILFCHFIISTAVILSSFLSLKYGIICKATICSFVARVLALKSALRFSRYS